MNGLNAIHCFNPGDTVCIGNVGRLKNALSSFLEEGARVKLDFSNVVNIDSIGIQLIIAFTREAKKRSVRIESIEISELAGKAMERIRLNRKIMDESV